MSDKLTMGRVRDYLSQGKTPEQISELTKASMTVIKAHLTRLKHQGYKQPEKAQESIKPKSYCFDTLAEASQFWITQLEMAQRVPVLEKLISELTEQNEKLKAQLKENDEPTTQNAEQKYKEALPTT